MDAIKNRRDLIAKRKQDLIKTYGPNPLLYSSGKGIESELDYPEKLRINLDLKVIKECLFEKEINCR